MTTPALKYAVSLRYLATGETDLRAMVATWDDACALARHLLAPGEYLGVEVMSNEPGDLYADGNATDGWLVTVEVA